MRRFSALAVLFLFFGFVFAAMTAGNADAQTFRGAVSGVVTDSSGGVIPGALVTVTNAATGLERNTQAAPDGTFHVKELPVGTYSVTVTRDGFEAYETKQVKVEVASDVALTVVLPSGTVKQEVVVNADAVQLERTTNTLGETLTEETVKNLPVNGRDYTKLIYLSPGVAGSPDQISDSPGSYGPFSMNGARGRSNNFLLDGTDMNDGYRNDPALNEPGVFGTPATILPIDAVTELRVLSNFEPEYGRNAGAQLNIVTKSGGNQFHGNAFEYFRNNALDARNYFNQVGSPQAPFHNNQFGGSAGGPIVRDKTFFFADYEGQRERVGTVSQATVPDPAALATATNPVIQQLIARDPWPAVPGGGLVTVISPSFNNVTSVIGKIDENINANNLLTGRYYYGDSVQSFPLALSGGGILPGFNTHTPTRVQLVSLSYVSVLSPTKVNELRMGWNRFAEGFFPQDQSFAPSSIGLNTGTGVADEGLPVINVTGFAPLGASHSDPRQRWDGNWQALDNFSWTHNSHSFKFGFEWRRTSITQFLETNFRGSLDFDNLGDFLAGNVDDGGQSSGNSERHSYQNNDGLYFQDNWRVSSQLSLNYGLRWDYYGVFHEKNNLLSNITSEDPGAGTLALTQVGQPGLSKLYNPVYTNFAPRVSFAWDPTTHGQTVIRAGWGMFFDSFSQDVFLGHLPFNSLFDPGPAYNPVGPAPIYSVGAVGGTIVPGQAVFATPSSTPSGDIFAVSRNLKTPYMMNYNLNVQQQLSRSAIVQLGYVGSVGRHLLHFRDINQPDQGTITATDIQFAQANESQPPPPQLPQPCYPAGGLECIPAYNGASRVYANNPYGAYYINQEESTATSNYNSFQASLRILGSHGITNILNYVWSHSMDTASDSDDFVPNAAQPNDSTRPGLEYGNSNFDIRNRLTWIFGYELPQQPGGLGWLKNGWGFDSTVTFQDGQPFNLNYNFEGDFSGSGEGFDRPDVVGPVKYSNNPTNFLQLTSFAIPCTPTAYALANGPSGTEQDCTPGTRHFGSLPRNSLHGLPYKNWDFALYKNVKIVEKLTGQFRAEFFNLVNHPNFSSPLLPAFIADAAYNGFQTTPGGREVSSGAYPITATGDVGIGNPFLGGGGPRGIQLVAKFTF
jgi:hypothetical protein